MKLNLLTAKTIENAVRKVQKPRKLWDGGGLYLMIRPDTTPVWRMKYVCRGRESTLGFGSIETTSLPEARNRRDAARKLLADGTDPAAHRKATRAAAELAAGNTFRAVALEWLKAKTSGNRAMELAEGQTLETFLKDVLAGEAAMPKTKAKVWVPANAIRIVRLFDSDILPHLGSRPVAHIEAPEILTVVRKLEKRGALDTAHRALQHIGNVIRYAIQTGRASGDPTPALLGALPPVEKGHFAALIDPAKVGELLRAIDGYSGNEVVRCALRLAPLLFVRPRELRFARWNEIDLDAAQWSISAERMKMRQPHIVPLSTQALEILRELRPYTGQTDDALLFPSTTHGGRAISDNTLGAALKRIGYDGRTQTAHGFRAMARTILDEQLGWRPDYIEHQLAHKVKDPLGTAYNRTKHLPERAKMMQAWADYLDGLKADGGGKVVPFKRGRKVTERQGRAHG